MPDFRRLVTIPRRIAAFGRMTLLGGVVLALALLAMPPLACPALADGFTPAQRAQIVAIMREALKKDPSILRDAVTALQADDAARAADATTRAIATHQDALLDPADPTDGNPNARVTLVEFFDVRCPYCRQMEPGMDRLLAQDHDLKIIYKDLPILGPPSVLASHALLAAQRQGKYLPMRAILMSDPPNIDMAAIEAAARKLHLDWPRLQKDMQDPEITRALAANVALAHTLGIDGTPAFVLGNTLIPGAVSVADLQKAIAAVRAGG